ncbi:DNA mismatch repair protein MutS [Clostridium sp. E02]|uniref:endonuclease MutS2 n=1 Tax=Clostridium sp. E02 TaxID=2487134 RepID=UPI000F51F68F|nr:DNA mismatch repair protein MutS [Clostridium sp. E02]
MKHTYKILEFNRIIELLEAFAHTEGAKERIENLVPDMDEGDVKRSLSDTSQARTILDRMGELPAVSMFGLHAILRTVEQDGFLIGEELERIGEMLTGVERIKDFLNRCKYLELSLPYYEQDLNPIPDLKRELAISIRNGSVEDRASNCLKNIRQNMAKLEEKRKTKAESILRDKKKCCSDSFITLRNGRICLPVKKDYKAMIHGSVIDRSSTGSTLFIEPKAIIKFNEALEQFKIEEENEVRRILYTLTAMVEDNLPILVENKKILEKLDFIFAKGKLSASMKGVEPEIILERRIHIENGRHPFLDPSQVVPLDFEIGYEGRGIVITGPNTGGKTVSIKTVGLFSLMAQCGLHIPCERAKLCLNRQLLCDIGDGQNITENLSTFSAHIKNALEILNHADEKSLVIMDELGSGTDPAEGMGIAVAILEELRNIGCLFLVTTHYPEVKTYAEEAEGITNARMAFDKESLKPLYRMEIGAAGESCALFIARSLGMPEHMIQRADRYAYGERENFREKKPEYLKKHKNKPSNNQPIKKAKPVPFAIGDSVMLYPAKQKGIVCRSADEKGILQVQLPNKKIFINWKRVKLLVASDQLYPENYDFSIVFDTVENRKARHKMEKGYQEDLEIKIDP